MEKKTHYGFAVMEWVKGKHFNGVVTQCGIRFDSSLEREVDNVTSNLSLVDCIRCRRSIKSVVKKWK